VEAILYPPSKYANCCLSDGFSRKWGNQGKYEFPKSQKSVLILKVDTTPRRTTKREGRKLKGGAETLSDV
jgi:hypothetical protein